MIVSTFMAGILLIAFGLARFGAAIKFIPHPVVTGFTSGIAVIIFSSQIRDLFGLTMDAVPAEFVQKWLAYSHAGAINWAALLLSLGSILILVAWPRVSRRIPAPFVALILGTVAARVFDLPVETIGSRFGEISASLPRPHLPHLTFAQIGSLIAPAFTIALLGAVDPD